MSQSGAEPKPNLTAEAKNWYEIMTKIGPCNAIPRQKDYIKKFVDDSPEGEIFRNQVRCDMKYAVIQKGVLTLASLLKQQQGLDEFGDKVFIDLIKKEFPEDLSEAMVRFIHTK